MCEECKDPLDLYSEAVKDLSKEERDEFAMFFIGALSADVSREVWVKALRLTEEYIKRREVMWGLEGIKKVDEVQENEFYIYPSYDVSIALVLKGAEIKDLIDSDFAIETVFSTVRDASFRTAFVLALTFHSDIVKVVFNRWDEELNVDELVVAAYVWMGYPLKRIMYGSELHKLLDNKLVGD